MHIKSLQTEKISSYTRRLNDPRYIGQLLFVVVVLLISWSGIKTIQTNYNLQKQISALREQNTLQTLQNDNLNLNNQYFNSNQYLELSARQNFGLAAPGEQEILVPQSVALAYTANLPTPAAPAASKTEQPAYQRNFESWVNFFLHRQDVSN